MLCILYNIQSIACSPPFPQVSLQTLGLLSTVMAPRGAADPCCCPAERDAPLAAAQCIPISIPLTHWPLMTPTGPLPLLVSMQLPAVSHRCHISQIKLSWGSCLDHAGDVYYNAFCSIHSETYWLSLYGLFRWDLLNECRHAHYGLCCWFHCCTNTKVKRCHFPMLVVT